MRTGQSPSRLRCVKNQGHLPVPVKIFKKSPPPKKKSKVKLELARKPEPPPSRFPAAGLIPESVTIAAQGPATGLHRTEFCGSMSAGRAAHERPARGCPRDTANLRTVSPIGRCPANRSPKPAQRHIVGAYLGVRARPGGGPIWRGEPPRGDTGAREGPRRPARGAPAG